MIITWIVSFLLLLGASFAFVAALGVVRMPDLYCRMHAATKAGSFGVSLMLLALCIALPNLRVLLQSLVIIMFFYFTAPVGAQMIGRVALQRKVPMWSSDPDRPLSPPERPPENVQ